ncbi:MAG TPA: RNA-binding cell elongation regulator Jag/EloR [Ktedonobacteraceae bacterium]|nr:RNA-binding cell elongation regulator Jag/EloR [Ktedonobacteraceae bacterium]
MESIEVSGKSVDDAVLQALVRLHKRRDEVEVIILQEPSRGRFGVGGTDARIRVTVLPPRGGAVITPEMADALLGPDDEELYGEEEELEGEEIEEEFEDEEFLDEDEEFEEGEEDEAEFGGGYEREIYAAPLPLGQLGVDPSNITVAQGEMEEVETPSNEDIAVTVDVLQHILQYINIRAAIQVRSQSPLTLNIQGINENLGLLIGRRGETLSALQLLVSLIVSHRTKHRMRIIVDAENYRERREENLRSLALRVAQQVRNYRRSIALEAMPPHERRIVHIALSDSKDISTESIGEGDARRVVISLKRPGR